MKKTATIDFERLKHELLVALRGERTQKEINQKLGRSFNQCAKWESGEKRLMWHEFLQLLDVYGIDIRPTLVAPFRFFGEPDNIPLMLTFLSGGRRAAQLAADIDEPREKIGRWLAAKQDMTLEEMLRIFQHYYPDHWLTLIEAICPINNLPTIYHQFKHSLGIKDYIRHYPYALLVLKALRTSDYGELPRHRDGVLAMLTGLTIEQEREALRSLVHHNVIEFREEKYRWRHKNFSYVLRYPDSKKMRSFFQQREQAFLLKHVNLPPACFMYHDVWAIPQEHMRDVIDMCFELCIKIRKLTENSNQPARFLRGINLSLFSLDD